MVDEMRIYHSQPDNLPAVLNRFVTITFTIQALAIRPLLNRLHARP